MLGRKAKSEDSGTKKGRNAYILCTAAYLPPIRL